VPILAPELSLVDDVMPLDVDGSDATAISENCLNWSLNGDEDAAMFHAVNKLLDEDELLDDADDSEVILKVIT
jgi:hypothetical protein